MSAWVLLVLSGCAEPDFSNLSRIPPLRCEQQTVYPFLDRDDCVTVRDRMRILADKGTHYNCTELEDA